MNASDRILAPPPAGPSPGAGVRGTVAFVPVLPALLVAALLWTAPGCSSSSSGTSAGASSPATGRGSGAAAGEKVPAFPPGKFTVQLGAFQSEEGAASVAALAKIRFAQNVYTVLDEGDRLYKVMLGVFDSKDLAREFRDSIVRQYPQEYRDAWVSELAR